MEKENGGPAFPQPICDAHGETMTQAMSLRDIFAKDAPLPFITFVKETLDQQLSRRAEIAYKYADAMLAERAKN